jgi:glycosyltransferase involved in cell wall biosynthesis
MCRVVPEKKKLLVGTQGLCAVYADAYFADLPKCVVRSVTLRDFLKQDSLREQQKKFVMRGEMEIEAIKLSGNITGRTHWDKHHTAKWNPKAIYHEMNETLRPDFYEAKWDKEACEPHSIFLSQGDYPIKGLHYMVEAMPQILESYPDAKVYVAGNSLLREGSLVQKLKISAYGRYLTKLLKKYRLQEKFIFLGRLNADQMKAQYLKSHLFVCPSSIENSPNSLGEAMLLGMPCVSADVGGIASIFTDGEDGLLYEGFLAQAQDAPARRKQIAKNLADAVESIWSDETRMLQYCESARAHAMKTHNKECNLARLKEIYASMVEENKA